MKIFLESVKNKFEVGVGKNYKKSEKSKKVVQVPKVETLNTVLLFDYLPRVVHFFS